MISGGCDWRFYFLTAVPTFEVELCGFKCRFRASLFYICSDTNIRLPL